MECPEPAKRPCGGRALEAVRAMTSVQRDGQARKGSGWSFGSSVGSGMYDAGGRDPYSTSRRTEKWAKRGALIGGSCVLCRVHLYAAASPPHSMRKSATARTFPFGIILPCNYVFLKDSGTCGETTTITMLSRPFFVWLSPFAVSALRCAQVPSRHHQINNR